MKANALVALLFGLVLGIFIGRATGTPGEARAPAAAAEARGTSKPALPRAPADATVYKVSIEGSPMRGPADAPVTLVEFSDYQCPFCSRADKTVEQLRQEYGSKLRIVMKEFPLPFHPNAKPAALAALAAGQQGKYWELHDKLFANQGALDPAGIERMAKEVGVDLGRFNTDRQTPQLEQVVTRDLAEGSQLGVSGTPAFFINGRKLVGAQPLESFKVVVDEELKKAEALIGSGVAPADVYAHLMQNAVAKADVPAPAPSAAPGAGQVHKIVIPADAPVLGPKFAKVTIVEFSDFQCPFCGRVEPTLKQVQQTYGKDVRIVWMNEPLPFHPNAKPAAQAALAAHLQGKFWQMHDKLFQDQQALDAAHYQQFAKELGLNLVKFQADMANPKTAARVEADASLAQSVGAGGTPNFFINGVQLVGALPFEQFKAAIDLQLAKANKLLASGVKLDQLYDKATAESGGAPAGAAAREAAVNVTVGGAPLLGPKNAPVTIVEFSDFQCPYCSRAFQTVKEVEAQYRGKVKVAFKNDPLPFHANAKPAAEAAMAANEQGKFWPYHDKLFTHQTELDRAHLEQYAQELGLDMKRFKAALDSNKFESQINADMAEGRRLGVNGTPSFFINGVRLVGAVPIEQFKTVIDAQLKHGK